MIQELLQRIIKKFIILKIQISDQRLHGALKEAFSESFGVASFFNSLDIIRDDRGCWKVCHSITTTLIGIGGGASAGFSDTLPVTVSVGTGKYTSISTSGSRIGGNIGVSISVLTIAAIPADINIETVCFYLSENDSRGCPCKK